MIFGIPSYHRPECKTINTLLNAGVETSKIVVSVQDEYDLKKYKENFPEIQIIFRKTDCAAGNRNTLLEYVKERPICLLDDDISSFSYFTDDGKFLVQTNHAINILQKISKKCELIGIAPTSNNMVGRNRSDWNIDVVLQGTALIINSLNLRFDERYKMVEDYEIALRTIYQGGHTLRYNYICANKPDNGTNKGGMHERYINNELPFFLKALHKQYPIFKVNKSFTGGEIKWT